MYFKNIEPYDWLLLLLFVLVITAVFVMVIGGLILKIKEAERDCKDY